LTAFTLIELILVLALIVIMAGVTVPRMAAFFRGRTLDNEARRFMTLTRYAQNRAVAEGIPMLVWIDESKQLYGLEAQPGYLDPDPKALEYRVAEELEIEVGESLTTYGASSARDVARSLPANLRFIRFGPDGFLSEVSPEYVLIGRDENDGVAIAPSRNWQQYEILTNNAYALLL
jgi:type II secretory pathway pseudopilin PulG